MSITRLKPPFNCVPYEMPIFFLNKNVELLEKCWITRKMCTDSVKFRSNLINRSKRANRMDLVHSHYPPSSAKLCATGKKTRFLLRWNEYNAFGTYSQMLNYSQTAYTRIHCTNTRSSHTLKLSSIHIQFTLASGIAHSHHYHCNAATSFKPIEPETKRKLRATAVHSEVKTRMLFLPRTKWSRRNHLVVANVMQNIHSRTKLRIVESSNRRIIS